jgi:hypothetical protein
MRPLSDRSMSLDSIFNYPDPGPGKKKKPSKRKKFLVILILRSWTISLGAGNFSWSLESFPEV